MFKSRLSQSLNYESWNWIENVTLAPKVSFDGINVFGRNAQLMTTRRPFSPDLASFAVDLERFLSRPGAQFSYQFKEGQQTVGFLK